MNFAMVLLGMFSGPFIGAVLFKKKFGRMIGFSLWLIMALLYGFYVMDCVIIGYYAIVFFLCIGVLYSGMLLLKHRDRRNNFGKYFLTPAFFVLLILILFYRLYVYNSVPIMADELRQWAAMPKAIFVTERLQLGTDAVIFDSMQSYYPGLGLLQYFFQKLNGFFADYIIYLVYAVLGASFILPVCDEIPLKKKWTIPLLACAVFLLPLTFYNQGAHSMSDNEMYYKTLYIDGLLGLAVGGRCLPCGKHLRKKLPIVCLGVF